jgi:drug/metabolite transporter (DMT)-like permease
VRHSPDIRPSVPAQHAGPSQGLVLLALSAVQVVFGTHYVAGKVVLEELPPLPWAALRVTGAALLLLALTLARRQRVPLDRGTLGRFAGFAVLGVVINQICFVEGLSRTTPVHSSLINCSIPVLTLVLAILAGRERVTPGRAAGFLLALTGVLVLLRVWSFDPGSLLVRGDLITLVNSLSFSAFLVVSKPQLERMPALPATCLLFLLGALMVVALAAPGLARLDFTSVSPSTWALAAYIIVFPTVGAYFLNFWALRRAASSLVAFFIYLQPLVAAAFAVVFLDEAITAHLVLAFLLVAGGIALVTRNRRGTGVDLNPGSHQNEPCHDR